MKKPTSIAAVASIICFSVYLRTLTCDFVGFDDPWYVQTNEIIRHLDLNLVVSAFTESIAGFWMPLTWLSFAIEYSFWGLNPVGYHLTNNLLHAANAALVVLLADLLCRKRFAESPLQPLYPATLLLAGLLFAIHPLRVESVAWITERKDVLNGVFTLISLLFYLKYVDEAKKNNALLAYSLSLLFFILSLLSKSVSVVLPAILLVADWYPLHRLRRGKYLAVLLEKVPFLIISITVTIITLLIAAHKGFLVPTNELTYTMRIVVAGNAIFEYCRLLVFPIDILPFHLLGKAIPLTFIAKMAASFAFTFFLIYIGRRRPLFPATWLVFLLPLLPVLGFVQNGDQAFAARFTYLPSVFPSIVVAVAFAHLFVKLSAAGQVALKKVLMLSISALLLFYAGLSLRLMDVWRNTGTFWSRVIEVEPIGRAYKERGLYYLTSGRHDEAFKDLSVAIEYAQAGGRRDIFNLYAFRGEALANAGRFSEAIQDFTTAISQSPREVYYFHRALALRAMGDKANAEVDFSRAGRETGPIEWYQP